MFEDHARFLDLLKTRDDENAYCNVMIRFYWRLRYRKQECKRLGCNHDEEVAIM